MLEYRGENFEELKLSVLLAYGADGKVLVYSLFVLKFSSSPSFYLLLFLMRLGCRKFESNSGWLTFFIRWSLELVVDCFYEGRVHMKVEKLWYVHFTRVKAVFKSSAKILFYHLELCFENFQKVLAKIFRWLIIALFVLVVQRHSKSHLGSNISIWSVWYKTKFKAQRVFFIYVMLTRLEAYGEQ